MLLSELHDNGRNATNDIIVVIVFSLNYVIALRTIITQQVNPVFIKIVLP